MSSAPEVDNPRPRNRGRRNGVAGIRQRATRAARKAPAHVLVIGSPAGIIAAADRLWVAGPYMDGIGMTVGTSAGPRPIAFACSPDALAQYDGDGACVIVAAGFPHGATWREWDDACNALAERRATFWHMPDRDAVAPPWWRP